MREGDRQSEGGRQKERGRETERKREGGRETETEKDRAKEIVKAHPPFRSGELYKVLRPYELQF